MRSKTKEKRLRCCQKKTRKDYSGYPKGCNSIDINRVISGDCYNMPVCRVLSWWKEPRDGWIWGVPSLQGVRSGGEASEEMFWIFK